MKLKSFTSALLATVFFLICVSNVQVEGRFLKLEFDPNMKENITKLYDIKVGGRTMRLTVIFTPNKYDFLNSGKLYKEVKPNLLRKDCDGAEERIAIEKGVTLGVSKCSDIEVTMKKSKLTLAFAPRPRPPTSTGTITRVTTPKTVGNVLTTVAPPQTNNETNTDWTNKINPRFGATTSV